MFTQENESCSERYLPLPRVTWNRSPLQASPKGWRSPRGAKKKSKFARTPPPTESSRSHRYPSHGVAFILWFPRERVMLFHDDAFAILHELPRRHRHAVVARVRLLVRDCHNACCCWRRCDHGMRSRATGQLLSHPSSGRHRFFFRAIMRKEVQPICCVLAEE